MKDNAALLIHTLTARGLKIATAESLTGGMLAASLVDVPGASKAYVEGIVAYAAAAKERTLGISREILDAHGTIAAETAEAMAAGAAALSGADMAVSTTGNAGPDADEGKPVGLVYVSVLYGGAFLTKEYHLSGTRNEIRSQVVDLAVDQCLSVLGQRD